MPFEDEVVFIVHPSCRWKAQGDFDSLMEGQYDYIRQSGGVWQIREADDKYNGFNFKLIDAFYRIHGAAYLGKYNYYDPQRKRIIAGEESVYMEYTGQTLETFCCTFCVPVRDSQLEELLNEWIRPQSLRAEAEYNAIKARIKELGGIELLWF